LRFPAVKKASRRPVKNRPSPRRARRLQAEGRKGIVLDERGQEQPADKKTAQRTGARLIHK
jgi:hypothetical protein